MNNQSIISAVQSRVAHRGAMIAAMEADYSMFKLVAQDHCNRQAKELAWAIRDEIRPLAIEQKLDRDIMREINNAYLQSACAWKVMDAFNEDSYIDLS